MSTSKENSNASNGGIGFVGALTILFIALKLLGHITWSWWWVLSPIWIVTAVVIGFAVIIGIVAFIWGK